MAWTPLPWTSGPCLPWPCLPCRPSTRQALQVGSGLKEAKPDPSFVRQGDVPADAVEVMIMLCQAALARMEEEGVKTWTLSAVAAWDAVWAAVEGMPSWCAPPVVPPQQSENGAAVAAAAAGPACTDREGAASSQGLAEVLITVTGKKTKVYHHPGCLCTEAGRGKGTLTIKCLAEAEAEGLRACQRCKLDCEE